MLDVLLALPGERQVWGVLSLSASRHKERERARVAERETARERVRENEREREREREGARERDREREREREREIGREGESKKNSTCCSSQYQMFKPAFARASSSHRRPKPFTLKTRPSEALVCCISVAII